MTVVTACAIGCTTAGTDDATDAGESGATRGSANATTLDGDDDDDDDDETDETDAAETRGDDDDTTGSASPTGGTATGQPSGSTSTGDLERGSTGADVQPCAKNVVLMGYWPPTNEMLRAFSQSPRQNPGRWIGGDWGGHGYDVYAFFPEFPPDGDPSNDPIGSEGSVGSPESDLRVDYQDTSEDFWAIVDDLQPVIVITTSRGGGIGWEIEAVEGGHGGGGPDPAQDWTSDGWGPDTLPFEGTVDARTWDAISTYRGGVQLESLLPMEAIEAAASARGLTSVQIDYGTSGNYLSGFLGLHGLYYANLHEHAVAAGHIHVANGLPVPTAETLIELTLQVVLETHPADGVECPPRPR